jgi:hypothetical protein
VAELLASLNEPAVAELDAARVTAPGTRLVPYHLQDDPEIW